jgi:hypothetical protein
MCDYRHRIGIISKKNEHEKDKAQSLKNKILKNEN